MHFEHINAKNFGKCTHMYNVHEVFTWQPQIFKMCKPYFFSFTSMILWVFLVWQPYLVLASAHEVFTAIYKYIPFGSYSCSFTSMTTCRFHDWQAYFFPFLRQYLLKLYTCVYVQNTNALGSLKLTASNVFVRHICSFSSMIPLVFYLWHFTVIHKYFTLRSHMGAGSNPQ